MPYSLPIRQTYSTCRTANSFLRLLSDHRLYTTCSSTGGRLTARIWQRLNLLVGSRIDPYLFHRNNYTLRSIPFTIFSWSTTIPTYLIQKDDSYTAYIARDDFYNTRPRPDPYSSSPFHDDYTSTRSNLKRPTQRKIITYTIDRFQPCVNRDFSLSLTCYRQRGEEKTKVPFLDVGKIRYEEDGRERRSIDSVQRRRRVRTAQSEPEEFRRLDISSDDHPARSGRPINRQDLAGGDRPWEKFASPHASSRSIDFIVGARRCIWCGKISYSPHLLFPFLYLLSIDGSNFNRFSFSRNHLYYRHFGTINRWMYENFYFAIKIRDPLIVTREQIYMCLDWFCFVEQWDERDWRIIKPSADKRYSWEKQWGDILFRSIANRFWTDIKIYGSSLFHSDFAPSSHQLETSFYFPGCIKKIVCETVVY